MTKKNKFKNTSEYDNWTYTDETFITHGPVEIVRLREAVKTIVRSALNPDAAPEVTRFVKHFVSLNKSLVYRAFGGWNTGLENLANYESGDSQ
jgi:hypothetical protein